MSMTNPRSHFRLPSEILCFCVTRWKMIAGEMEEEEYRGEEERMDWRKGERERGGVIWVCWLTLTLLPAPPAASWVFIHWRRLFTSPLYKKLHTQTRTDMRGGAQGEWCSVLFTSLTFFFLLSILYHLALLLLLAFLLLHQPPLWVFHPHSWGSFLFTETVGRARNRNGNSSARLDLSLRCLNTVPGLLGCSQGEGVMQVFCSQMSEPSQSVYIHWYTW